MEREREGSKLVRGDGRKLVRGRREEGKEGWRDAGEKKGERAVTKGRGSSFNTCFGYDGFRFYFDNDVHYVKVLLIKLLSGSKLFSRYL